MILKINGYEFSYFNEIDVTLSYDSVASVFGFSVFIDPKNPTHKNIFRPCSYNTAVIEHEGNTLITGTILSHGFTSSATPELVSIGGYSKTGVLEDCQIPPSLYPLQSNRLSLIQIAEKLCRPFGMNVKVDASVQDRANQVFHVVTASNLESIKSYLCEIASQKRVMVTHDEYGNLVLTQAHSTKSPFYDFAGGEKDIAMSLSVNGQKMFSEVNMIKQATLRGKGNTGKAKLSNPYCKIYKPYTKCQTSGEDVDTEHAATSILSAQLKEIKLEIELQGWYLGGQFIRPNNIITVQNEELYLNKKTKFFIESVNYKSVNGIETSKITCYLPEVYNFQPPINIFEA